MSYIPRATAREADPDPDELELLSYEEESAKDVILFLIDAGPRMHDTRVPAASSESTGLRIKREGEQQGEMVSLLHRALEGAVSLMRQKLVASPRDLVGVMLYNTQETNMAQIGKTSMYEHTYMLEPIGMIDIANLAGIIDDLDLSREDPTHLRTRFEPLDTEMRIHHAWSNALSAIKQTGKTGSKRIFFVTHTDDPYAGKANVAGVQRHLEERVGQFSARGIEFEPFLLETDERGFDVSRFWGPIFAAAHGDGFASTSSRASTPGDGTFNGARPLRIDELDAHVAQRHTPKRVNFRGPLKFGKGCTIGVKGYGLVKKAEKGNPTKVLPDTAAAEEDGGPTSYLEVDTRTEQICVDTGKPLGPNDVEQAFFFGSDASLRSKVKFGREEIARLKSFGQKPGIEVLGFKPNALAVRDNIKTAYFLYPFDDVWKNSRRCFAALITSMLKRDVMGIAIFMRVQGNQPVFCALLPQAEERGRGIPAGMHLIPLPYADDIREVPTKHAAQLAATQKQVEAAKLIVKAYAKTGEFRPEDFPNPALAHHYEVLINTALGKPLGGEELVDRTLPNYGGIQKRVGPRIAQWCDYIAADERLLLSGGGGGGGAHGASFGTKDAVALLERHSRAEVSKLKVDELKAALEYYRLAKAGKKAELVERLEDHLDGLEKKMKKG